MISALQRSKHLDKHIAALLRDKAKAVKKYNDHMGWGDACGDIKRIREFASLWTTHQSTRAIRNFYYDGDTAWRESVPRFVDDVIRENHNLEKAL